MQQKREADEQQKSVAAYSEKISAEEVKCKAMADNAQRDLDEAVPALEEATKVRFVIAAVHSLSQEFSKTPIWKLLRFLTKMNFLKEKFHRICSAP